MPKNIPTITLQCLVDAKLALAQNLAQNLNLPLLKAHQKPSNLILQITANGLQLVDFAHKNPQILRLDFGSGKNLHRLKFGGGLGQMLAKACGLQAKIRPTIVDATAGCGADAWQLAGLGCNVIMCERSPIMATLLNDALNRAQQIAEFAPIVAQLRLITLDAVYLLAHWRNYLDKAPQVIYLDPMFAPRTKTAQVKKEMQILHKLVGYDVDNEELLKLALDVAQNRVVVKRPKLALPLANYAPNYALCGKSSRFDIYTKRKLS